LEWARFWAKRGYICVSFDYSGDTNSTACPSTAGTLTKWGSAVEKRMATFGVKPMAERCLKDEYWHQMTMTLSAP